MVRVTEQYPVVCGWYFYDTSSVRLLIEVEMLEYKRGNIFKTTEQVIVHGCNCFNSFGAGIALEVYNTYPDTWMVDQLTKIGSRDKLGTITYNKEKNKYYPDHDVIIVNAYTQYKYTSYEVDVEYDKLMECMVKVCETFDNNIIAMPKIGCGLAGGDWNIVSEILETVSNEYNRVFRVYTL
jgi:O-acetyl-ADP-ribose deacetylase (regulator of RNase III)